ncbi:uncharacterized protein LOC114540133 [Dendronephthya gigantea]|uniref:uncharacterized protein LOC114530438 n=1 Tax=Dendronephthya gigantea TaxID=151771 RepID=UPI001069ECB8|nr:uncharacterized protein LOC114530438 [Dendronephthya gigantea]XP_028410588.1 uncharacterized protein LOC114533283 [Dendronephthya gigantea]XP_028416216.1 uncharacterized protein LOC114540133 [Dendronephthya gigantea]
MAESEECAGSSLCVDSITVNTCLKKGMKRCSGCGLEQGIAKKVCKNQGCSLRFPTKEKNLDALKNMSNPNITQQRKHMEKRADILNIHNNCDIVILMHHKHGSGDTLTFYGTEGAGVSFIGNKSTIETSEGGRVALNLFRKFIEEYKEKEGLQQLPEKQQQEQPQQQSEEQHPHEQLPHEQFPHEQQEQQQRRQEEEQQQQQPPPQHDCQPEEEQTTLMMSKKLQWKSQVLSKILGKKEANNVLYGGMVASEENVEVIDLTLNQNERLILYLSCKSYFDQDAWCAVGSNIQHRLDATGIILPVYNATKDPYWLFYFPGKLDIVMTSKSTTKITGFWLDSCGAQKHVYQLMSNETKIFGKNIVKTEHGPLYYICDSKLSSGSIWKIPPIFNDTIIEVLPSQ